MANCMQRDVNSLQIKHHDSLENGAHLRMVQRPKHLQETFVRQLLAS